MDLLVNGAVLELDDETFYGLLQHSIDCNVLGEVGKVTNVYRTRGRWRIVLAAKTHTNNAQE